MSKRISWDRGVARSLDGPFRFDEEMTELAVLLPGWQASELEQAAQAKGLTAGQLVRGLIRDFLAQAGASAPGRS
jgi:hypothetical protein